MEHPEHRKKAYTTAEIARKTGLDPATLWRIQNGKSNPHKSTMYLIASALKVKAEDIAEFAALLDKPSTSA
jgi:transcriptional regulator with XRE-family HTH domain